MRQFQLKNSKSYKSVTKPATENLGLALKMIKKRRSLFEHGEILVCQKTDIIFCSCSLSIRIWFMVVILDKMIIRMKYMKREKVHLIYFCSNT